MSFLFLSPVIFEMIWNIAGVAQGKEKEPQRFHYILNDSRCMLEICHCQLQIRYQKLFACVMRLHAVTVVTYFPEAHSSSWL